MSFTALEHRASNERAGPAYQGIEQDVDSPGTEVDSQNSVTTKTSFVDVWKRYPSTVALIFAPYLLGYFAAVAHFALYDHLHRKKVNLETSLPQAGVSAIALVLVTIFRLALLSSLGLAFTQILWRRIRSASMTLDNIDHLPRLKHDLSIVFHLGIFRVVPTLSMIALLGWLITAGMILPPGSIDIVRKSFDDLVEQRVQVFNSSSFGNGTFSSALDNMLATQESWQYLSTRQPVLATAKAALVSGDIVASTRGCRQNCSFVTDFQGPSVKCKTLAFNEVVEANLRGDDVYFPPVYSGGWTSARNSSSSTPGWYNPHENDTVPSQATNEGMLYQARTRPDTFFVSQHSLTNARPRLSGERLSYQRATEKLECQLYRGNYTVTTKYVDGLRKVYVVSKFTESLNALWGRDSWKYYPNASLSTAVMPKELSSTIQVINLFALVDGLVQALSGEYYNTTGIVVPGSRLSTSSKIRNGRSRSNQTIIADSVFNLARFALKPTDPGFHPTASDLILDLTEARLNAALQNITLSVMYAFDRWHTTTNMTQSSEYNMFSFSSRRRLIIPYVASLVLSLPFLCMGLMAMRANGEPGTDTASFMQALVATAGSERLRCVLAGCREGAWDVPKSVREMRIGYGEVSTRVDGEVRMRRTFGIEDEFGDAKRGAC
ncbi:hypothetical protein HBI13_190520 [Parastagonospora nodorum]|nr:hypothetical protein HBI10_199640 [Parastagonospora nodorum]KAH4012235.1 hypothetical protein HBI13_190520 [Parastagonospora nodorum]